MAGATFYGWRLLGAFWLILMMASAFPLYGGGVMNAYMATDLSLAKEVVGAPMALYQLVFGLGAPVAAITINRFGVRSTLVLGALLLCAGALVMATLVRSGTVATLVFGLVVGAGGAMAGGIATQTGVARWFLRRRALAFAILMSAPGIGGFFVAPLINRIILTAEGDWRAGWWLVAVMAIVAGIIALAAVRESPEDLGQVPDGVATGAADSAAPRAFIATRQWDVRDVLTSRTYWLMLLAVLGINAGFTLFFAVGVVHLVDLGHTRTLGAWALSIFGISALLAKIMLGALGDRIDPRYLWAITIAAFGIGMLLIADARSVWQVYGFAVLLGFGFGGNLACMMAVLSNYYGPAAFASIIGIAVAITTCAGVLGPIFAGALYDRFASYAPSFLVFAVWCAIGTVLMLIVRRPADLEAPVSRPATMRQ